LKLARSLVQLYLREDARQWRRICGELVSSAQDLGGNVLVHCIQAQKRSPVSPRQNNLRGRTAEQQSSQTSSNVSKYRNTMVRQLRNSENNKLRAVRKVKTTLQLEFRRVRQLPKSKSEMPEHSEHINSEKFENSKVPNIEQSTT
jgi:type VI protein secretion system component VasK